MSPTRFPPRTAPRRDLPELAVAAGLAVAVLLASVAAVAAPVQSDEPTGVSDAAVAADATAFADARTDGFGTGGGDSPAETVRPPADERSPAGVARAGGLPGVAPVVVLVIVAAAFVAVAHPR